MPHSSWASSLSGSRCSGWTREPHRRSGPQRVCAVPPVRRELLYATRRKNVTRRTAATRAQQGRQQDIHLLSVRDRGSVHRLLRSADTAACRLAGAMSVHFLALARIAESAANLSMLCDDFPELPDDERVPVIFRSLALAAEHVGATPEQYAFATSSFIAVQREAE